MSRAIQRLTLRSFRGATEPVDIDLDTDKPLVVIFGENGCGKSSLIDGIDFIANGSYGSLMHRSVDGQRHPFLASLGHELDDIEIGLQTKEGGAWIAKLSNRQASVQRISNTGELPVVHVLRRAEILDIVEATPAKRYEALGRFIDVSSYENSETTLREALRNVAASLERAVARLEQASSGLENYWQTEGATGQSARAWAKTKSEEDIDTLKDKKATLKSVQQASTAVASMRTSYGRAISQERLARRRQAKVQEDLKQLPAVEGTEAVKLVALLREASPLVQEGTDISKCPLCLHKVKGEELRKSIADRLSALDEYVQLADRLLEADRSRDLRETARKNALDSLLEALTNLASAAEQVRGEMEADAEMALATLCDTLKQEDDEARASFIRAGRALSLYLAPLGDHMKTVAADLEKHNAIRVQYEALVTSEKNARHQEQLHRRLEQALEIVENTRKTFVDLVLISIGEECQALYARIHPGESLGKPRLTMHEGRRGSVELGGVFEDQTDIRPQGYYSESHLDTLGFCVWLAIAKRGKPEDTVLLIDDVFTSVDAQHISRIVNLISDVARDFAQVIVATHYRNWRDRYRLSQAPGLEAQLLELHRWTLARGISLSSTSLAVEELNAKIETEPLERQAVASQAGILLEALLDYLTLLYRRRLPRNQQNEWTLNDLLSACRKLCNQLSIERDAEPKKNDEEIDEEPDENEPETIAQIVAPFYEDMGQLSFVRNQVGCHFNLAGGEVSDGDVRAFGKATSALVGAIVCEQCGQIPSRRKGDHFACTCGKTRMRPLEYTG